MADNSRFSEALKSLINMPLIDGKAMIAISRAILRNDYSQSEFESEFLTIFILIDDETGDIVLDGFGDYNTSSERYDITSNNIANFIKILTSKLQIVDTIPNIKSYEYEIQEIERLYSSNFHESLRNFRRHFEI